MTPSSSARPCRAETATRYSFGDDAASLGDYAWYANNAGSQTHDAAGKLPNAWGLYDMHGNVWEWCGDQYSGTYYGERPDPDSDPPGPAEGGNRVFRSGSWYYPGNQCRSAHRSSYGSTYRDVGFRVAAGAQATPTPTPTGSTGTPTPTPHGDTPRSAPPGGGGCAQRTHAYGTYRPNGASG